MAFASPAALIILRYLTPAQCCHDNPSAYRAHAGARGEVGGGQPRQLEADLHLRGGQPGLARDGATGCGARGYTGPRVSALAARATRLAPVPCRT